MYCTVPYRRAYVTVWGLETSIKCCTKGGQSPAILISLVRAVEGATLQLANVDGVWLINVTLVGTGAHLAACCCVVEMLRRMQQ
jgi:hypothetical protein